tara:strand:+ start:146 stop:616 length:471 start_codon:yes stop_codon:yes gene_type:complete
MPGIYLTKEIKELGGVLKLGTLRGREDPAERLKSLIQKHYYPNSIKEIENSYVIAYDKQGNRIDNKHPLFKLLNSKCIEFETNLKSKYRDKQIRIVNHAHLTARDKDGILVGSYEKSILNNGGSDFLKLDKKEIKEVNVEIENFKGEFERYFNDIS